jgi:hypothetical protein
MSWLRRATVVPLCVLLLVPLSVLLAACDDEDEPVRASGLWFAFPESLVGGEGAIRIVHLDSGEQSQVGEPGQYRSVAWSPDGERLAAIRVDVRPELVVFDFVEDMEFSHLIESDEAQVSWSPDGQRVAVLSAAGLDLLGPNLTFVARVRPPEEGIAPAAYSSGMWSDDSALFAAYFHGYVMVADRMGKANLHDPRDFVRFPGQTRWITVTAWEDTRSLSVFEESERPNPTRYVLSVGGDTVDVLSSADFEEGAGPFDGLIRQASSAAGGSDVIIGRSAAPPSLRWVVAEPGPGDVPPRIFVRRGGVFVSAASGLFGSADPVILARDLAVLLMQSGT